MKASIHPTYNDKCQVSCACGNKFTTGSTIDTIDVEVCSKCHPFFTGQHKFVDIKGRIDKFNEKMAKGATYKTTKSAKVATKKAKKDDATN
ncbi:50S ribosomal protein L31 [Candidatus Shapirobacteria bacterium]|nr:50S ribosomal protein L31 [Candidatus Shapirobacteria bacterium]